MDEKAWTLLLNRFDKLENDLSEIRAENSLQTKMIGNLKVTVAGVSGSVAIIISFIKAKVFGG